MHLNECTIFCEFDLKIVSLNNKSNSKMINTQLRLKSCVKPSNIECITHFVNLGVTGKAKKPEPREKTVDNFGTILTDLTH